MSGAFSLLGHSHSSTSLAPPPSRTASIDSMSSRSASSHVKLSVRSFHPSSTAFVPQVRCPSCRSMPLKSLLTPALRLQTKRKDLKDTVMLKETRLRRTAGGALTRAGVEHVGGTEKKKAVVVGGGWVSPVRGTQSRNTSTHRSVYLNRSSLTGHFKATLHHANPGFLWCKIVTVTSSVNNPAQQESLPLCTGN